MHMSDSYGKRPMWQWILLYVVIAAVVYGLFYYFVLAGKGGYGAQAPAPANATPAAPSSGY